jgi:transcription initiation factor TFIIIB Brf1 subunit/transcription initiation factor TFIIB
MSHLVDESAEWRNFADSDKDQSRVGMVNEWVKDLSTDISSGTDGKMSKIQQRVSLSTASRNLLSGFDKIGHISEMLSLPDKIKSKAKDLFTQFEEKRKKSMRGSKADAIIAAIIYRVCKEAKVPRTFKEITRETGIDERKFASFTDIYASWYQLQTTQNAHRPQILCRDSAVTSVLVIKSQQWPSQQRSKVSIMSRASVQAQLLPLPSFWFLVSLTKNAGKKISPQ